MRWKRSILALGAGATLLGACRETLPTEGHPGLQAAKQPPSLKVTPAVLDLPGTGATATLSVSQFTGSVSVVVSAPACVSVVLKVAQKNQLKYTVTATAAGSCTVTVTDGATGNVQVAASVAGTPPIVGSTLAAGLFHTCGLDTGGAAWCWGLNGFGQLGSSTNIATTTAVPNPQQVAGGQTFTSITAGYNHSCGLTALGSVYCWGANYAGQLGDPTGSGDLTTKIPTPVLVQTSAAFTAIEAGNDFTCGLTAQGELWCWGSNSLGQLGTATNNGTSNPNVTPTLVPGGLTFTAFTSGAQHTCGVVTGGAVYCWGHNNDLQLGQPNEAGEEGAPHPTPTLVQGVPALVSLVAVNHTCGLTAGGDTWCWGGNQTRQLGAETPEVKSATPVQAAAGLSFVALGAGGGHTCGLTVTNAMYCWGSNLSGQLGTSTNFGTSTSTITASLVSGLSVATMGTNAAHTCALTTTGEAWCFGANAYGQLGNTTNNGTSVGVPTPTAILGGLTFATP